MIYKMFLTIFAGGLTAVALYQNNNVDALFVALGAFVTGFWSGAFAYSQE